MRKNLNYERFNKALEEQKTLNFINLKKDIESIKCFIENALSAALETSQTKIERDYHVTSL